MGKTLQAREESGAQPVSSAPSASHEYLLFCSFFCPEFHQVSLDEIIYLAIHHTIDIGGLVVGTMVFHTTVVEHVATDLGTPFDLFLSRFHLCLFFHTMLQFLVVQD